MSLRKPSRTVLIIVICLVVITGISLYAWMSAQAWQSYKTRLESEKAALTALRETALKGSSTEKRIAALRELDDRLDKRKGLCDIAWPYAWQALVVPPLKEGVDTCRRALTTLNRTAGPLSALRGYVDTGESVASALKGLAPSTTLNESNWSSLGLERAQAARKQIEAIKTEGEDAKKLKDDAATKVDAVVTAWQALIAANGAKDRTVFITASSNVVQAYAQFAALADTVDQVIKSKVEELGKITVE